MPYLPFAEVLGQVAAGRARARRRSWPPPIPRSAGCGRPSGADEPTETLDRAEVFEAVHALLDELSARAPVVARGRGRPLGRRQHPRPGQLPALAAVPRPLPAAGHLPLRRDAPPAPAAPAGRGVGPGRRGRAGPARAAARRAPCGRWSTHLIGDPTRLSATTATTTTSAGSSSAPRATRSTSRSSSPPSSAAAGACPRTSPTCCWCAWTGSTSRRATSSGWPRPPASGSPTTCSPGSRRVDEDRARGRAARRDRRPRAGAAPAQSEYAFRHALLGEAVYDDLLPGERMRLHTAYAEAVRELLGSPRCRRPRPARPGLPRPADRPAAPASRPATWRWPPAVPTRRPGTSPRRWRSTRGPRAELDDPPDEAELVARTVDALCASGRPETAMALVDSHLDRLPADVPDLTRARLLLARVEAMRATEAELRPSVVTDRGARPGRPGADDAARPHPGACTPRR